MKCVILLLALLGAYDMESQREHEFVDVIEINEVLSRTRPKEVVLRQLIFKRWKAGDYRIVGYMVIKPEVIWESTERAGSATVRFTTRSGKQRTVTGKSLKKSISAYDKEMLDRKNPRECLFGSNYFGDVRSE